MSQLDQVAFTAMENAVAKPDTAPASASRESTMQFENAMRRVDGTTMFEANVIAPSNKSWGISFSADGAMDSFRKWMEGLSDRMKESGEIMGNIMKPDVGMKDLAVMVQKMQNINLHFQSAMECVKLSGQGFQNLVHKGSQ